MKPLIAVAMPVSCCMALLSLAFNKAPAPVHETLNVYSDSEHVGHVIDGTTNEWPDSVFHADKETLINYAVDNDGANLFIALRVADFRTQMKMMRQGMTLFIDMRGKKKENMGIEYPVKPEGGYANNGNMAGGKPDKKAIREAMSYHLFAMKLFGFTDAEPVSQGLQVTGSANIAFGWDSSDVMHIEYSIPLSMLGETHSLHNKMISLGWRINGAELQSTSGNTVAVTSIEARPAGGNRGGGSRGQPTVSPANSFPQTSSAASSGEQSFWTKYSFRF